MRCDEARTFERGADVRLLVDLTLFGAPRSLPDHIITADIWWEKTLRLAFAAGTGIDQLDLDPPEGEPHFVLHITEEQSALIPMSGAYLRVKRVAPEGFSPWGTIFIVGPIPLIGTV